MGASLNVYINTGLMKDRALAKELDERADMMTEKYSAAADEIFEGVCEEIRK